MKAWLRRRMRAWLGVNDGLTLEQYRAMVETTYDMSVRPLLDRISALEQPPAQAPASQPRDHEPETLKAEWDPHMGNG